MDNIGKKSEAHNRNNEDFIFTEELPSAQLLVVGDFAQTEYLGVDATAVGALETLMQDSSMIEAARSSAQLLLAQLASQFNARLLVFTETYKARFQTSVLFAVIQEAMLYYLPIGDCRLAIRRRGSLILLNGSVWLDSFGHSLPILINSTHDMIRGPEPPPDQALGINTQMNFQPAQVEEFSLERDDLVLLYSDGLDKFVSPARVIELIEKHATSDSAQALTERILNEARVQHGDDDRTLLIMAGPHLKPEDKQIAESRHEVREVQEKFDVFVGDMRTRVTSLESKLVTLSTLPAGVEALNKSINEIGLRVAKIPTVDETKTSKAKSLNSEKLTRIEDFLKEIEKQLKAASDRPRDSESKDSSSKAPESKTSIVQATVPVPASLESPLVIHETDFDQPFREGLILVQHGFYELVDETQRSRLPTKSEFCFSPSPTAPAGWLTAFCLYLRLQVQPLESASAESVRAWLLGKQNEGAECISKVDPLELRNSRELHWRIRDHRARGYFSLSQKDLIEQELGLAQKLFPGVGEHSRPSPVAHNGASTESSKVWDYVKRYKLGFTVIAIAIAILAVVVWFILTLPGGSKPPGATNTTQPIREPVHIEYGADGRTLLAGSRAGNKPLDYRIKFGKEEAFQNLFAQQEFASVGELVNRIESDAATLVSRPDQAEWVPDNLRMMSVEPLDVSDASATTTEKCERFLKRVNLLVKPHNDLAHLQQLNPGLRCNALRAGDQLVILAR